MFLIYYLLLLGTLVFRDFKTKVRRYLINRANEHLISWFVNILDLFIYLFIYLLWINKWLFYLFNINNNYNNDFITVFPPKGWHFESWTYILVTFVIFVMVDFSVLLFLQRSREFSCQIPSWSSVMLGCLSQSHMVEWSYHKLLAIILLGLSLDKLAADIFEPI